MSVESQETLRARIPRWVFGVIAAAPVVFLFAMIQMSAITVPFWDHWEQAGFIVTYYDHGAWAALRQVFGIISQHTRPITVRLIFLVNAALTRWSLASEYVFMYAAIGLTLLVHYRILRKLPGSAAHPTLRAALFSVIAIVYCSPANHNNHWWSWMLQLNVNNLLAVVGLSIMAFRPRRWSTNVAGAILAWLAVYTLTNGLFLIGVLTGLAQIAGPRPWRVGARTAFWLLNLLLVYWCYFPIQEPGMTARPGLRDVLAFSLMYIGHPIAALIQFDFTNQFEPSPGLALSMVCGAVLLLGYLALLWAARGEWRDPPVHVLILVGFGAYALLSAAGTGWARVTFDQYGIRNGNSSRYVITGSNLLFGMLYFTFVRYAAQMKDIVKTWGAAATPRSWVVAATCAYVAFVGLSARAYADSVKIYKEARDFNGVIGQGFLPDASDTDVDQFLYPERDRLRRLRNDLVRLRIGPYRYAAAPQSEDLKRLAATKAADQFGVSGLRTAPHAGGRILFAHPYSRFETNVSPEQRRVRFAYGILPGALTVSPPTDGVEFRISIQQADGTNVVLWTKTLRPLATSEDRAEQQAVLSWDGKPATKLLFETLAAGATHGDWAYWSNLAFDK